MRQTIKPALRSLLLISLCQLIGCVGEQAEAQHEQLLANANALEADAALPLVWALNVGGAEHRHVDGTVFQDDNLDNYAQTSKTLVGQIEKVSAVQDSLVFQSYRMGHLHLKKSLDNGVYDITFLFAEPEDIAVGTRVFDVVAEQQTLIEKLDIRLARDGNHQSALASTITGIEVSDGALDLELRPIKGKPVISGLIVRGRARDHKEWKMIWNDEFDYSGVPDPGKWTHDIWPASKVNSEDQAYTDRLKNVRVADGRLIIEAHKELYDNAKYSSGRIHSLGKGDFLYGRAEVRAKLATGQGSWSAIWMLPSDPFKYATSCDVNEDWQGSESCDAWPNSGEIDIMEHVGYDMHRIHGTVHTKAYYWVNGEQRKASVEGKNVDQIFHAYAIEWSPERIDIFLDDSLYFSYINQSEGWQAWPFDHPYHIILNLAIGGDWGRAGGPIDDRIFPARMEIDYVRVYAMADR